MNTINTLATLEKTSNLVNCYKLQCKLPFNLIKSLVLNLSLTKKLSLLSITSKSVEPFWRFCKMHGDYRLKLLYSCYQRRFIIVMYWIVHDWKNPLFKVVFTKMAPKPPHFFSVIRNHIRRHSNFCFNKSIIIFKTAQKGFFKNGFICQ